MVCRRSRAQRRHIIPAPQAAAAQRGRLLVQAVLGAAAVLMVVAGVAIWLTAPSFLARETVPLVAMALVLAGVFDGLMAWGFGRWWPVNRRS